MTGKTIEQMNGSPLLALDKAQDDEEREVIPRLYQSVTMEPVFFYRRRYIQQVLELKPCGKAGVQVFSQGVMIKVNLHPFLSHAAIRIWLPRLKVIANVTAHHQGVGVIHRKYQTLTRFEKACHRGEKAFIVVDIIEYKMAGSKIEVLAILRQRLTKIGNLISDLVIRVLLAGHPDEIGRDVYAGDMRAATGEDAGKIALAASCIQHRQARDITEQ